jgi:hypothetical protein
MAETITHIVLFKYKPDISWEAFEKHFEQFMSLKQRSISKKTGKPLIKSLKAGKLYLTSLFASGKGKYSPLTS